MNYQFLVQTVIIKVNCEYLAEESTTKQANRCHLRSIRCLAVWFCRPNQCHFHLYLLRMNRKMLMMSRYRFSAAKMYSSGLIEYLCLPPIMIWVSYTR